MPVSFPNYADNQSEHLLEVLEQKLNAARGDLEQSKGNLDWQIAKSIFDSLMEQYNSVAAEVEKRRSDINYLSQESPLETVAHNIPVQRLGLIGRVKDINNIVELIKSGNRTILISGMGGIGKSALAIFIAQNLLDNQYFDVGVWLTAKDSPLTSIDIVDTIAQVSGIYPKIQDSPILLRLQVTLSYLSSKRTILIFDSLDNNSLEVVNSFIDKLPSNVIILMTSRERISISSIIYPLSPLSKGDGILLLKAFGKFVRSKQLLQANNSQLGELFESSGGVPLALVWAAGHISHLGHTLDRVIFDLLHAKGEVFDNLFGDTSKYLSNESRSVLTSLANLPGPATQILLQQTTQLSDNEIDVALDQLLGLWLIEPSDEITKINRRYEIQPLTKVFTKSHVNSSFDPNIILIRACDYYENIIKRRSLLDRAFIRQEISQAFSLADQLEKEKIVAPFQQLVNTLALCLDQYGMIEQRLDYGIRAMEACRSIGDEIGEAWHATYNVAHCLMNRNDFNDAEELIQKTLHVAKMRADKRLRAIAIGTLGSIKRRRDRDWETSVKLLDEALNLWNELGDSHFAIIAKLVLATPVAKLGNYDRAKSLLKDALKEANNENDDDLASIALGLLGRITLDEGDTSEARRFYKSALLLCKKIGRISGEPHSYMGFATVDEREGKTQDAIEHYLIAEKGYKEVHNYHQSKLCGEAIIRLQEPSIIEATSETIKAYDQLAVGYAKKWGGFHNEIAMQRFRALLADTPHVLDLACGTGRDMNLFASEGILTYGIDLSREMLNVAKQYNLGGAICRGDMMLLPFARNQFDGVWASACFLHIPHASANRFISEIARVTETALFLSLVEGEGYSWDKTPKGAARFFAYYSKEIVANILVQSGFEVLDMWNPEPPESYPKWLYILAIKKIVRK